ncbi:DUF5777 family beta-barrel protein [Fulvivirgaceae bacterium BMA10]|uniref:DUF5777 family beta-barrel protein n=1 Tax=Splendidivirga corallicola TaxID=3051826 RepID=A0ABT8KKY5_9BACT|nr:DUF5777 family beta-barrel protein [Fulvivirgaceae bacterium BMA10]
MNRYILFFLVLLAPNLINAQDDLLEILEKETSGDQEINYTFATFKATRVINGQSVETTAGGVLSFIIGHRFGKINDGFQQLFGLDQSTIRFGLEYGITDNLNIGFGRSSFQKTFDGYLKYKFLKQSTGAKNMPITVALFSSTAINGLESDDTRKEFFSSRMSYTHQLLIARKFSNNFSFQLTPTFVHRNLVATTQDENDVYALGAGARYKLNNRVSINAEYFYQLPGENADKTKNSISLGFDIETGGHVFQLHVTNSKGMVERYFVTETSGDITEGDIFFGFNINRVFTIVKKDQAKN